MKKAWESNREAICFWFDHTAPLLINTHQFYYVNLPGVPLICWHDEFFSMIGKQWGTLVEIDENTRLKTHLDMACIILRVACPSSISKYLQVEAM
ncbi:hypothetical protein V6N13_098334 [Hibiscus sabdariffa]|uniref:Uncharacterized protein n=1 Tax=Hibiscus sabdariffa TaxID=183260 RepID=A0ABR2EDW8_9ROSI